MAHIRRNDIILNKFNTASFMKPIYFISYVSISTVIAAFSYFATCTFLGLLLFISSHIFITLNLLNIKFTYYFFIKQGNMKKMATDMAISLLQSFYFACLYYAEAFRI